MPNGNSPQNGTGGISQPGTIIGLKTSTKKPGTISADYSLQLTTYGLLAGKADTKLITMARTKVPSWCQHTLNITPGDLRYAANMYDLAAEGMESGLYIPNRNSHLCSRRYWAFWRECQAEYRGTVPG